jgi:HEPN domain-containing protein
MKAEDFFNAYLVLKENNEAKHPTVGVEIVCLAFSVELYIKDLHFAIKGEALRGHDIRKLFEALPEQIRQEIFAHDSISQNPFITRGDIFSIKRFTGTYSAYDGFIDHIDAISKGFEKWRYSYESTTLQYDVSFALAFIDALKSAACRARTNVRQ